MRRVVYQALLRAPVKVAGASSGVIGFVGSVWPDRVKAVIGEGIPVQPIGIALLVASVIYFALLWLLKPGAPKNDGGTTGNTITTGGPNSHGFGVVHGDVNITHATPAEKQERKQAYSWDHFDKLARALSTPSIDQLASYARINAKRRCPETPILQAARYLCNLGKSQEDARLLLQQAFSDDSLDVWGRPEVPPRHMQDPRVPSEIWKWIEPVYWEDFRLSDAIFDPNEKRPQTEARPHLMKGLLRRFWNLKVDMAEVKHKWPEPKKPPPDLGPHGWMAN